MKKLLVLLILIPVMLINAQMSVDEVKEKIKTLQKESVEYMLAGDSESGLKFYCEDAYSLPSYHPIMHGMAEFKKSAEEFSTSGMEFKSFELTTVDVMMCGNLAIEIGTYTMTMEMPQMPMPYEDKGKYLNVYNILEDGTIKIKVETWNSDINPWEDMMKAGPPPPPPAPEKK